MVMTGIGGLGYIDASIDIAGWDFEVHASGNPTWDRAKPSTVVIIKGARGALPALLAADNNWIGRSLVCPKEPKDFGAKDVLDLLIPKIDDTADPEIQKSLRAAYAELLGIIDDEEWMGVIVLHCPINPGHIPDQVQAVLGGIKPERFLAHHVALRLNRLQSDSGNPVIGTSPLFGVIDYLDPSPDPTPPGTDQYGMAVSRIVVGFPTAKSARSSRTYYCGSRDSSRRW